MSFPLFVLPGSALAFGGSFAGPVGAPVPTGSGLQLALAPSETGTTVVAAFHVAAAADDLAVVWPLADAIPNTAVALDARWLERLERTTRARVEALSCEELVDTVHWKTVPGCASYDYVPPPPDRGEDAALSLGIDAVYAPLEPVAEVIGPDDLDAWLTARGLALDPVVAAALAERPPTPLLTIWADGPVSADTWLAPVSVRVATGRGPFALPLTLTANASTRQEVVIYGITGLDGGNPLFVNFPKGTVPNDCVLPPAAAAAEFLADGRAAAAREVALPPWFLDHASNGARCSPCTDEPLDAFTLSTFGFEGSPADARLTRLFFAYPPNGLDEDPVLAFEGPPVDLDTRFLAYEAGLQFAFQVCGESAVRPNGAVCDNVRPPGTGCDTTGQRSMLFFVLLACLLARRRMGPALVAAVALGFMAPSAWARPTETGPKTELLAVWSLVGTNRVVPEGVAGGAPWLLNPYVGLEGRRSLWGWRDGHNIGLTAGVRGFSGRAAPFSEVGAASFTVLEPFVGGDIRHGQFRKLSPCWFWRAGAGFVVSTLWPSTSGPRAVPSAEVHTGVGAWLGKGQHRTAVELRGAIVPRTDGFETRYHPNTGISGFLFFPGTANLFLVVGAARY